LSLVLSLALALVYLASSLGTLGHFLVVEHVRCLEHGEWLHAADLPATHRGTAAQHSEHRSRSHPQAFTYGTDVAPDDERAVQPENEEPPHTHDHCGQTQDVRLHHDLAREVCVERSVVQRFLISELAAPGQLLRALSVYVYAPKTSPPRSLA